MAAYLWHGLQTIEGVTCLLNEPPAAGLVSFQLADIRPDQAVQQLEKQAIFVRSIIEPSCIRAGLHYFSSEEEIDKLLAAIPQLN
jgi:L-cysteine/cystine lyase